jgi:EpsI family protein
VSGSRLASAETLRTGLIGAALVAVGAAAWTLALRPPLDVDTRPLAALPEQLGAWTGQDVALEDDVVSMLRADFNIQRRYRQADGGSVWLYIGYYGTDRGGHPEHTPDACYVAQGWRILDRQVLAVPGAPGLRVNEYLVEQAGEQQLVQFWYQSFRSTGMLGGLDQTVDRLTGRLLDGRADGALVRLSTVLGPEGRREERARMLGFAAQLEPALDQHWPVETAGTEAETPRVGAS